MTNKFTRIIIYALAAGFVLLFFVLNVLTPLIADDFIYSAAVSSIKDIFSYQYNHYFTWGGRSVAHAIAQFWLLLGKPAFNVANTIIYVIFILLVHFHITGSTKKVNPLLFLGINIFMWAFVPAWGHDFVWLTGSCNYLWTAVIILLFLLPYRLRAGDDTFRLNVPVSMLFFFLGVAAGWCNENSGAAVLAILAALFAAKAVTGKRPGLFETLGLIGFLAGFVLMIAAPGNYARADSLRGEGIGHYDDPFLLMMLKRGYEITMVFVKKYGIALLALSFIAGFYAVHYKKRKLPLFAYLYALAALAGTYSMIFAPYFPVRAYMIVIVFLCITLFAVLTRADIRLPEKAKRIAVPIAAAGVGVWLSLSVARAYDDAADIHGQWEERTAYILSEKAKGNLDVEVKGPIEAKNRHSALLHLADLDNNANGWPNGDVARHFGLNSIKISDSE